MTRCPNSDPITLSKTLGSMVILRLFELISVAHTVICYVAVKFSMHIQT